MPINAVPTNVITGFLGAGKTSAILHLLQHKPANERWAVLVNEFGEIGIDGSLLDSANGQDKEIFIREVPGGCMCCAAGLPMHIALNQLLQRSKPDRLLIEPSGLGHPKEVLQVLHAEHYQDVLDVQSCITLLDARKLNDERYSSHSIFLQQIEIADVIIANKEDLYSAEHGNTLDRFLQNLGLANTPRLFCTQGQFPVNTLYGSNRFKLDSVGSLDNLYESSEQEIEQFDDQELPSSGYLSRRNKGSGYSSIGWRFSAAMTFNFNKLQSWINNLNIERLKAVCITEESVIGFNKTPDGLQILELDDCIESRFEIISETINDQWESELLACVLGD